MARETRHVQRSHEQEATVRRKASEFQEAPGEAEADASRDAFLQQAGAAPATLGGALTSTDSATRARAVHRLQQEQGNAFVQRVVAETRGTPGRLVGPSQPEMVQEVLQRKGAGSPLPATTRERMEGHFGADLGGVRVHADGEVAVLNRELQAQAFTVGSDVFFAEGKYDPQSTQGQGLLAHELTHVGQQTGFGGQAVQREGEEEEPAGKKPDEEEEGAAG